LIFFEKILRLKNLWFPDLKTIGFELSYIIGKARSKPGQK
jgi:hypothetical protein